MKYPRIVGFLPITAAKPARAGHKAAHRPHHSPRLDRLTINCDGDGGRRHALPIAADFIGWNTTHHGTAAAGYRCPACKYTRFFVADYATGKPRQLFAKGGR